MVVLFVWTNALRIQMNKLIGKFEEIATTAKTTTGEVKQFTERTIAALEKLRNNILSAEYIRRATTEAISIINHNHKKGKK